MKSILLFVSTLLASLSLQAQLTAVPPNIAVDSGKPMVMLNMSRDHQLFYRAYNEYTDINLDGTPDTTYNHSIDYYGYFDPYKCYSYSGTASKFSPVAINTNRYCEGASAGNWSGNFLNWATMTRVDVVRKVLYGGYRSTDTASGTVLERSYLPTDSHSFAKYYNGTDTVKLTPFTATQLAPRSVLIKGLGNWWEAGNAGSNVEQVMSGITICNTTMGDTTGSNRFSQTNSNPPLMKVAFGDFSLWNANERWQCYWDEEGKSALNGNNPSITGLSASPRDPNRDDYWAITNPGPNWRLYTGVGLRNSGAGPDYVVRADACVTGLIGKERCKQYPDGNFKPLGLLQEFGEDNLAEFSLITGSYSKNISGGVLRKNMESFRPEVNYLSNGSFTGVDGIVKTLDKIRIYGYDYTDGTYQDIDSNGNWCSYQLTGLVNNQCTSWGNPLGEMFLESLRYLSGQASATSAFDYTTAGSKDNTLGLGKVAWVDPFLRGSTSARTAIEAEFGKAQCRAMNVLNFNASVISYDKDDTVGLSDLTSTTLNSLLTTIGQDEGINGTQRLVGGVSAAGNKVCDAKSVTSLADVEGLCPDAPAYKGSYSLAGLAYWAHTNKIRNDIATTEAKAFKVDTYSVALSPGTPRITVVSQTDPTKKVIIQPAYRLDLGGTNVGGGTLVDFRIVTQTPSYGKYLIVWEDSEQGGDYDQDVTGTLEYFVNGNELKIRTFVFAAATANPQGFGYVVSGTQGKDGVHYHSGILGFSYTDSTNINVTSTDPTRLNASGGCVSCQVNDPATTATYTIAGGNSQALLDPLYYAAKWGGFSGASVSNTATPTSVASWDSKLQDGSPGSDGVPDNYFVVYRPDLLEAALRQVFQKILDSSNTAPAVSSSELRVGSLKYEAKFDPKDQRGQLDAYAVQADGSFASNPTYSGDIKLTAITPALRQVVTNVGKVGVPFTTTAITASVGGTTYLNQISTNTVTLTAIIDYMRGDRSNEGTLGVGLRKRNAASIMGAVINSVPWLQRRPGANYGGPEFPNYGNYVTARNTQDELVWIGANDGMLHGFRSNDLTPIISYVPGLLSDRIKNTADPAVTNAVPYVDGSAFTADVIASGTSTWATYLFSSLGRSKPGIFALDVTNPSNLNETGASSMFKWQFSASDDADLGYMVSAPLRSLATGQPNQVAKFRNGKFGVVFGNGVQSSAGKAALYILFVQGPGSDGVWQKNTEYVKLTVPGTLTNNGLSQVVWSSDKGDNVADAIYAGDLQGNMWKFNVSSSTPSSWTVSYGKPLYEAKSSSSARLPITGAPVIALHPQGGRVVVFGTGRSLTSGDFPKTNITQRIFGIWDKPSYASTPGQIPTGLTDLINRPLTVTVAGSLAAAGTQTAIDWTTKKGYYADIPLPGGAVITNATISPSGSGNSVFGITVPNGSTQQCGDTSGTAILEFDPISGGFRSSAKLDGQNAFVIIDNTRNNNNPLNSQDRTAICTPDPAKPEPCECKDSNGNKLCIAECTVTRVLTDKGEAYTCTAPTRSRIQWREIPGLLTRP